MNNSDKKDGITSLLEKIKKGDNMLKLIVAIGLLAVGVLFLSSVLPGSAKDTAQSSTDESAVNAEDYRMALSEELGNMIASIEGAGRTKIMLTLKNTEIELYATDNNTQQKETSEKRDNNENADRQSNEKKECIIVRQKDGSEKALSTGRAMPQVNGVLVVCDGGDNEAVCSDIKAAVSAALNISEALVFVTKLAPA